jgi:drug/metabolite transporter (DMT)-like permease
VTHARHVSLGILGAFAFSNTLVWGRAAQRAGAEEAALLAVRFALTGLLVLLLLAATRRPLLPARGERGIVFGLGIVAYGVESVFFFLALARGSPATVVLLFYTHVVIVAGAEVALGTLRPSARIGIAITLALGGGALVTLGSGGRAHLTATGFGFVLGSIACYSAYVVVSARLVRRTEPITAAAWVAFGAATGVAGWGVARGGFGALPAIGLRAVVMMAIATAAAFALWFVVVPRLGSTRTAIIMMLEAPFSIVLARIAFGDSVRVAVAAGGVLVLAGALLAATVAPHEAGLEAATSP